MKTGSSSNNNDFIKDLFSSDNLLAGAKKQQSMRDMQKRTTTSSSSTTTNMRTDTTTAIDNSNNNNNNNTDDSSREEEQKETKEEVQQFQHDESLTSGEIGIAVSNDGIIWRRGGSPTEMYRTGGDAEAFQDLSIDVGAVLYPNNEDWWVFDTSHVSVGDVHMISSGSIAAGGVYWMYYQGGDKEEVNGVEGVRTRPGLCLSQDGRNWARIEGEHHTHAVLDVGAEGEWDELCIRDPKLLLAGPKDMRLFYHSIDKTTNVSRIGVATSKDGFVWQKNRQGCIFDAGPKGSIDDLGLKSPCVATSPFSVSMRR